ncbi:N-6 DNA methylase [Bradyrhizobium pachyrhizi]|uniref:Eco57I restriction-modification methylase domain-containing protein n=1 Tax=Bradyrhizobium pachyrhizi TaxID=280333 RepID=UPI0024B1A240|nr:DNA methyltransferase [Bradyrhizobium pachyrhizi]WFU56824.1 N-6 DNA methylase [Bradyrhizobium pachyrhizi]
MSVIDPNAEWIGNVQPTGLVVAANVLARHGLNPSEQTRADTETVRALLSADEDRSALRDPWAFFMQVLGWRATQVAGTVDGPAVPADLSIRIEESAADLAPHWAVSDPDKGWQLLVRLEAPGVEPDQRGALQDWEATPHQQLERLLRETDVPAGLLLTDNELRVVFAPRGETSGWLKFPLRSLGEVGGRPMLGGLKLMLSSFRLHNDAPDRRLIGLLKESREAQAEVSTKLAAQVLGALHELLRGLHSADRDRIEALAASRPGHLYEGLLTVLLRLVFLLYAEDRDLIPSRADGEARALYDQGYGVRSLYSRLLDDAARYPDTMDERRGAWARLLALFRLVHGGDGTGWILGRGGKLFDPEAFPFLQGQDAPAEPPAPPIVSDGSILHILDLLLNIDGEQLSYRTLDVEQIGSVYETVMGFTIETRPGPAIAIRAGKNDRTPVFVDVAALTAKKGTERATFLEEEADRKSVTDKVGKPLAAATDVAGVVAALRPIVDERGSPGGQVVPPGTPLLQPTDERRRTGSHYTPRSLTEPIVRHALEPAFARLGPDATPERILDLKVCDPAMGSGAFLVEVCRALAGRVVKAWERWPNTKPIIPPDEDADLHAKRLVAQRCLYGVDKNPLATDLAKLSLWLATLARDHEFTFLDHALKCGDSLVGLTTEQIAAVHWDTSKPPTFVGKLVRDHLNAAEEGRARIRYHADGATEAELRPLLTAIDAKLEVARLIGNGVISAFFHAEKPKGRIKRLVEFQKAVQTQLDSRDWVGAAALFAETLATTEHPVRPFHWTLEFPEVFARDRGGFDAIVGNPPFLGGTRIAPELSKRYVEYLKDQFSDAGDRADLVSYFFRRSFDLLREDATFGLIASNTIAQGDTRKAALKKILDTGGSIARAQRRYRWPGEAAVVVSIIHVIKGAAPSPVLDGIAVPTITCFLLGGGPNEDPIQLASNDDGAFEGMVPYGDGFMATGNEFRSSASSGKWVFPFARGKVVNATVEAKPPDFIVYFGDTPLASIDDNELVAALAARVKPDRARRSKEVAQADWWTFWRPRVRLWNIIRSKNSILIRTRVSPHHAIIRYKTPVIPDTSLVAFPHENDAWFSMLQSRVHELWARFFSSSMKDDLRYTPSDCFRTFPFPHAFETDRTLDDIGKSYQAFRAEMMLDRNEGLTKIYNRFHARSENGHDVAHLRNLHAEMDRVVLRAYGWPDLAECAVPEFIEQQVDEGKKPKTRLDWPAEFKDNVLGRLLELNAERAAAERAMGVVSTVVGDDEIDEEIDT